MAGNVRRRNGGIVSLFPVFSSAVGTSPATEAHIDIVKNKKIGKKERFLSEYLHLSENFSIFALQNAKQ